jgi:Tat protein secretion system quality control protein TatD with DNase activity
LNQLLLETDSPEVYQGTPSEPKDLQTVLSSVSELYGKEKEEVALQTSLNAQVFFKIRMPGESP